MEPEHRLAEALQARATGAGQPPPGRHVDAEPGRYVDAESAGLGVPTALLIALVAGALLGTALALVSLLIPGVLPGTA
jgi:hypothetical protein